MPVNLKDRDAFHLTIEEYLLSLISLVEELVRSHLQMPEIASPDISQARLARNSVTLGDYRRPLLISQFTKDVFAGFQIVSAPSELGLRVYVN